MKCSNCKGTEFRQSATITFDVDIIVDENGKFMNFSGDLNDLAKESNIRDRTGEYTCTECETEYDSSEDDENHNGVCSNCACELEEDEIEFCNAIACQKAAKKYDSSNEEVNKRKDSGEYTCQSCGCVFDDDSDPNDPDNDISLGYVVCPHCETTVKRPDSR